MAGVTQTLQRITGEFHEATNSRARRTVMCGGTGAGANTHAQHHTYTGAARQSRTGGSNKTGRANHTDAGA